MTRSLNDLNQNLNPNLEVRYQEALQTLEDFCPKWAEKIRDNNLRPEHLDLDQDQDQDLTLDLTLDLNASTTCIVGEVYGFDNPDCEDCSDHAMDLLESAYEGKLNTIVDPNLLKINSKFKQSVINFVDHYMPAHVWEWDRLGIKS